MRTLSLQIWGAMTEKATIFISCGIFHDELKHLAQEGLFGENIMFLDAALHVNFDKLKTQLEHALEQAKETGAELRVIYGHCHPDNNWEKMFEMGREDFDFDFKSMFEHYKRIMVFDTGIIPLDEDKIRKFSAFTGLPVERKTITLDYFLGLIKSI
jgi:hypothetical protein